MRGGLAAGIDGVEFMAVPCLPTKTLRAHGFVGLCSGQLVNDRHVLNQKCGTLE
jgi:hypothetical protein